MKNSTRCVLTFVAAVAAGLTSSCGYTAPYQTSGPSLSKEGVQVTLVGEQCYVNRSTEEFPTTVDDGVLHVGLNLQIANHSDRAALIALDGFQLEEGGGSERVVVHPQQSGSVVLSPGQSTNLALGYTQPSAVGCHHDLTLDTQGAIAIEGKPVHVASIRFLPAR
jgi:hypothetical protein